MDLVRAFAQDTRVRTLVGLILLDVLLGIAASLRKGEFDWAQVGRFYSTMVLPMVLGFAAVWFVTPLLTADLLGEYSELLGQGLVVLAWGALVAQLVVSSILVHAKELWGAVSE
jgi:hypothetical protein